MQAPKNLSDVSLTADTRSVALHWGEGNSVRHDVPEMLKRHTYVYCYVITHSTSYDSFIATLLCELYRDSYR